jgi:hypothetical protein
MTTYLYIKTHKITGLKYLGKTTQDPFKYKGSGIRWCNHLNVHGDEHDTEILMECQTKEEVKQWGLYYSELWDVVKSPEWANLKPENGEGGAWNTGIAHPPEVVAKISASNKGVLRSEETCANIRKARAKQTNISNQYLKGTWTESPRKGKSKDNDSGYKTVSEKLTGRVFTWNDKLSEASRNRPKCSCLVCHRVITVGSPTVKHFKSCPNSQSL